MAITSITTEFAGQIGINPRLVRIISTDNLATVTAAGYLNAEVTQTFPILPSDFIFMNFNNGTQYGIFNPSISNGIITLVPFIGAGDVVLPVVSGDFAVFSGTAGAIADLGYSPTNSAKTKVVMANAAVTANHIAQFSDTAGTIQDGGVLGTAAAKAASDNTKATLASVTAATTSGHLAQFNDTAGTVGDSGVVASAVQLSANIKAAKTADIGGGGAGPITVSVTGLTSSSVVVATLVSSSNPVQVQTVAAGTGNFAVTFTGDPGASAILSYVAFVAAQ